MIIDTHCHLNYLDDLDQIMERCSVNSVGKIILPSVEPSEFGSVVSVAHKFDNVFFAVGVHPNCASNYDENLVKKYIEDEKCIAIGECGLDYFRLSKDNIGELNSIKDVQKDVLLSQLELAKKYDKPVIIHSRGATKDIVDILYKANLPAGGIIHCYSGELEFLKLIDKGFYFSYSGIVTFKNSGVKESLHHIPLDRVLVETDAPYLAPAPYRGKKNEPSYVKSTIDFISDFLNYNNREKFYSIIETNSKKIFRLV